MIAEIYCRMRKAKTLAELTTAYADWLDYAHANRAHRADREMVSKARHTQEVILRSNGALS